MRKLISYSLMAGMLFMTAAVSAQDYAFRVLANKGTNQVKKAGSGEAETLKTGAKLNSGDEIIASEGAYIGLMHKSGKTTEIRGAGTKKVSELEKNINTASTSIASRYASFVMNKMNESESGEARSKLKATGAVSRKLGGAAIDVMVKDGVKLMEDKALIRWQEPKGFEPGDVYIVTIQNIFGDEIYSEETDKTSFELDLSEGSEIAYEMNLYLFTISVKGKSELDSGKPIGVEKVKPNSMVEVQETLANLQNEVSEDSPLNKIIYASFFEEKELTLDALTKYEEAIRMSPDVEEFQELYQQFLIKNGFVGE